MPLGLQRYIHYSGIIFFFVIFVGFFASSVTAQSACQWTRSNGTACNGTGGYVSSGYNPYYEQVSCAGTPYYSPFTNTVSPCSTGGSGSCYLFTNPKASHCSKSYKQQVPGTSNLGQCESQPAGGGCWTGGTVYSNVEQCSWVCPTGAPTAIPTQPPVTTTGGNIAKGKPVIKYSGNVNYGDTQNSWPKVNDGDPNTNWLVSTNPATDVVIDLLAEYKIWSINYMAFWDSNFGSGAVLSTYISKDNQTWEKVDTREIFDTRTATHSVLVNDKSARYVRIVWESSVGASWNGWAEFKEIMVYTKPAVTGWVKPDGSACTASGTANTNAVTSNMSVHYSKAGCFAYATAFYPGGHLPTGINTACSTTGAGKCYFLSNYGATSWLSWKNPGAACKNYDSTYPNYVAGNRNDNAFRSVEECLWNGAATATTVPVTGVPTLPLISLAPSSTAYDCALQPKGDADCNGAVQSEDWTIWSKFYLDANFKPSSDYISGDFNKDGKKDLKDAEIWRMCFTTNCAGGSAGPSPTSTKPISPTVPAGCYYKQVQCTRAPCDPVLVCPTPTNAAVATATIVPTATPVNTALDALKQKFITDESSIVASTNISTVQIKSNTITTWNNGCKGCGGSMCTQVIVTGRRLVLFAPVSSGSNQCVFHVYHVNNNYSGICSPPTNRTVTSCTADPFPPPASTAQ